MDPKHLIEGGFFDSLDIRQEPPGGAAPGERFGRYALAGPVGEGGSSTVFRARDVLLNREVALKRLRFESGPIVTRFLREAELLATLSHPGIVPVYDLGRVGDSVYFTMPLIEGGTLQGLVSAKRPDPREAARIARDVALAVQHAHDHGIIHRDIKPSNVMIDAAGRVMVTDFGLGRREEADEAAAKRQTADDAFMGTLHYMSPEQARSDWSRVGPRSDVYSLGATLYETLTGRPPLSGDSAIDILHRISVDEPAPPGRVAPGIPWELDVICLRALEKEPGRRYPTMKAFAEDLDRFLRGEPVEAKPAGFLYRARKRILRNRLPFIAGTALVALGLLAALLIPGWLRAVGTLDDLAARIPRMVEPAADAYERAQLGRPADLSGEKTRLRDVEQDLRRLPDIPEALIQRGRILRLLGDLPEALALLDQGLAALGPAATGAHYLERGLVRIRIWEEAVAETDALSDEDRRAVEAEAQAHLTRAKPDLAEALRRGLGQAAAGRGRLAEAVLSFAAGDHDRCRELCAELVADESAGSVIPGEAWKLTARSYFHQGRLGDAVASYVEAYGFKGSDPEAYSLAAATRLLRLRSGFRNDPVRRDAEAVEAKREAGLALRIDPSSAFAWTVQAGLHLQAGRVASQSGRDPSDDLDRALEGIERVLTLRPADAGAWNLKGLARSDRARQLSRVGRSPAEELEKAAADYSKCLDLYPRHAGALGNRGSAVAERARVKPAPAGAAAAAIDRAIEDCTRSLDLRPGNPRVLNTLGSARLDKVALSGGTPAAMEAGAGAAIRDLKAALDIDPRDAKARSNLAAALLLRGRLRPGPEGDDALKEALAEADRAVALEADYAAALVNRGMIRMELIFGRGNPERPTVEAALEDFSAALRTQPRIALALAGRGALRGLKGDFAGALEDLEEAFRIDPDLGEPHRKALDMARRKAGSKEF